MRYGDEVPPTKEEHDKRKAAEKAGKDPPTNWKKVEADIEAMLDSRKELLYSISGPQYHAADLGVPPDVVGEPPETIEAFKERIGKEEKPDYKAQQEQLEQADARMRESVLREKREREHRS